MSDEFYNDMAATAAELLVEFGADASIVRSASTYDPATGAAAQASTTHAVRAVESNHGRSYVDGSLIEAGARAYLIDPNGMSVEPRAGDSFVWGGAPGPVTRAGRVAPGGVAVLFEVQVRGVS